MLKTVKLRQAGGSISATIPRELADRFKVSAGDQVFLVETDRGILLTPYDPDFADAMTVYEKGAKKFKNALRELSK